jgi:ABC-type Zn uptake system ZnuABC Zn-binding protein ZnuA
MNVFDWDKIREELSKKSPTRDAVITKAFEQYRKGNSAFEERSTAEVEDAFSTFRSAWIIAENLWSVK